MSVTEAELYQIIGELFVARAKTDQLLKQQMEQTFQMSKVIEALRKENEELCGRLEQPDNNNPV